MSKFLHLCLLLGVIIAVAIAAPRRPNVNTAKPKDDKWWTNSKATLLTSKSFETVVGKDKFVVLQFCATFSQECEKSTPEYDKLTEMYSGANPKRNDVVIARIDGWTFNSLSQTYNVKKFPTIKFFDKNDRLKNTDFAGEHNADKLSEWIETIITTHTTEAQTAQGGQDKPAEPAKPVEEKKPEEDKKVEAPKQDNIATELSKDAAAAAAAAAANSETKQPEAAKETNTANQADQQKQESKDDKVKSSKDSGDTKKEIKDINVVLNTTLLQAQFDEVTNQLNKLKEALEKSITDNFQKVETLSKDFEGHKQNIADNFLKVDALNKAFEGHKQDFTALYEHVKGHGNTISQLGDKLNTHKDEIQKTVTSHAEGHLNNLKDTVNSIKSKVHEKVPELPKESSGLMSGLLFVLIGGAIGGVAVFFLGSGGNKKRRSMLD